MRVRLIDDDEPETAVPIGESVFYVRRVPLVRQREFEAKRRREFRNVRMNGDGDQVAAYLQAVEDDRFDYLLSRWKGLEGDPVCTRENKLRLPESVKEILRGVAANPHRAEIEEAETKNSGSPSAISEMSAVASEKASS